MILLRPHRHALRWPAPPAPRASTERDLLSLAGGARGWTSGTISLVIRPGATERDRVEAAEHLLAGTGHTLARRPGA